jgi:hypothetical protein
MYVQMFGISSQDYNFWTFRDTIILWRSEGEAIIKSAFACFSSRNINIIFGLVLPLVLIYLS